MRNLTILAVLSSSLISHCSAKDLSGLYADAAAEIWPAGLTPLGTGTAAIGDGHVLTAAHVIAGCRHIDVLRDGSSRQVILLGLDSRLDLALLDDRSSQPSTTSSLATILINGVQTGDVNAPVTVTSFEQIAGAVSRSIRREIKLAGHEDSVADVPLLALAARLVPGTSGSPVQRRDGGVLGMVVGQMRNDRERSLAVRSSDLLAFLAYFRLLPKSKKQHDFAAQAVMVQCSN